MGWIRVGILLFSDLLLKIICLIIFRDDYNDV